MFIIKEIFSFFEPVNFSGNENTSISNVISLTDAIDKDGSECMSWASDKSLQNFSLTDLQSLKLGLLICTPSGFKLINNKYCNFLITENPRAAFIKIISEKFKPQRKIKTEHTAVIHQSAKIGDGCYIGHHVVIEENCIVGNNCVILHNTAILASTQIGNSVTIGCNNTIGNYGFGYEKDESGDYKLFEHLGNVVIHDNVEIHNNTCIDRGVLGSTVIHENVKIDNLVHIAHGVIIERNTLVIANALIGGSSIIGENSWIAPSATIKNKIKIGADNMIGMGAVVLKDTPPFTTMIGNPAISMDDHKKKKKSE